MRSLAVPREMVVTLITTLRPPFMLVYKYNNFTCHKRALSDIKIAQEPVRGCFLRVAGVVVVFAWRGVVAHCPAVFAFFSNAPVKQPKQSHLTARFYKQPNSYRPRTVAWMLNSGATLHWRPNRTVLSCAWSHLSAPPASPQEECHRAQTFQSSALPPASRALALPARGRCAAARTPRVSSRGVLSLLVSCGRDSQRAGAVGGRCG